MACSLLAPSPIRAWILVSCSPLAGAGVEDGVGTALQDEREMVVSARDLKL